MIRTATGPATVSRLPRAPAHALQTSTAAKKLCARLQLTVRQGRSVLWTATAAITDALLLMAVSTTTLPRDSSVFAEGLSQQVVLSPTTTTRSETTRILALSRALLNHAVHLSVQLDRHFVRRAGISICSCFPLWFMVKCQVCH